MREDSDVAIHFRIPRSLRTKINQRAALDCISTRALILKALRGIGFDIPENEIIDGRSVLYRELNRTENEKPEAAE